MSIEETSAAMEREIREGFNAMAKVVRSGIADVAGVQRYLTEQILSAPTQALKDIYREGYKTVFPDAKF